MIALARILIADDRADDRRSLAAELRQAGHEVIEAANGVAAMGHLEASRPDLVICDVMMSSLDGVELVRRIRDLGLTETPVILYTAAHHADNAQVLARQLGVTEVVARPLMSHLVALHTPNAMLSRVDAVLAARRKPARPASDPAEPAALAHRGRHAQAAEEASNGLRLAAIFAFGGRIVSERDPVKLLQIVGEVAREAAFAQHSIVGLLTDDGVAVRAVMPSGFDPGIASTMQVPSLDGGSLKSVVQDRRPVRARNASGRPASLGLPTSDPPVFSLLVVPLASPSRLYGWVALRNKLGADEFSEMDEHVAATLGSAAGLAYENARLYEDVVARATALEAEIAERQRIERAMRERVRLAAFGSDLGVALTTGSTPEETLGLCVQALVRNLDAAAARIWTVDESDSVLELAASAGLRPGSRALTLPMPLEDSAVGRVMLTGVPYVTNTVAGDAHVPDRDWAARAGLASFAGIPLVVDGRAVGVLEMFARAPIGEATVGALTSGARSIALGIAHARTERDRTLLEEQFRRAQKLEAVGQLAGGLAHDFNNLLTAILGYANLFANSLEPSDPRVEDVGEVIRAADRAAGLTRQLLAVSRRQILLPTIVDVNELVRETSQMLGRLIGERVDLDTVLAPDLAAVRVDPGQLEQIIMNLAVNARDAMPDGGRLLIETANVTVDDEYARQHVGVAPGEYVRLTVTDTGQGMTEDTRRRLFEPFFTTKERGQGTGLGLATVYGIVKQSGGHIWVYSEPGRGATFKIYLPRTAETASPLSAPVVHAPATGTETVLVVEDDRAVRLLARTILERAGYTVIEAGDPEEAERLLERHDGPLHLLLSDVVMPGGSGPALYETAVERRPTLKGLFMSGYSDEAVVRGQLVASGAAFLQKPFTADALTRKVRDVLDQEAPAGASESSSPAESRIR